jgi:hypothetical protein
MSRNDEFPALVTACAMFPRRPKVYGERIEMTVNEEVYLMSEHLRQARIPTFLGFPRVNSLSEFATDFDCLWFSPNSREIRYTHHDILRGEPTTECPTLFGPFKDEKKIHEYIKANATQQTWRSLLDSLFEVHSKISRQSRQLLGAHLLHQVVNILGPLLPWTKTAERFVKDCSDRE